MKDDINEIIKTINEYEIALMNTYCVDINTALKARNKLEKMFPDIKLIINEIGHTNFNLITVYVKKVLELQNGAELNKLSSEAYLKELAVVELLKTAVYKSLSNVLMAKNASKRK